MAAMTHAKTILIFSSLLEAIFQCQLHDARITRAQDLAVCRAVHRRNRAAEPSVVEEVEGFGAEIHMVRLRNSERARKRRVHVPRSGSEHKAPSRVAERAHRPD